MELELDGTGTSSRPNILNKIRTRWNTLEHAGTRWNILNIPSSVHKLIQYFGRGSRIMNETGDCLETKELKRCLLNITDEFSALKRTWKLLDLSIYTIAEQGYSEEGMDLILEVFGIYSEVIEKSLTEVKAVLSSLERF